MVEKNTITNDSSQNELIFITRVDQTGQNTDRRTGGQEDRPGKRLQARCRSDLKTSHMSGGQLELD